MLQYEPNQNQVLRERVKYFTSSQKSDKSDMPRCDKSVQSEHILPKAQEHCTRLSDREASERID